MKIAVRLIFVLVLLGIAAWTVDPMILWQHITPRIGWACILSLAIFILSTIFATFRLSVLANSLAVPFLVSWKSVILSGMFNSFIPGRVAELIKPIILNEEAGIPFGNAFAAVFLERIIDLLILFGLALLTAGVAFIDLDWRYAVGVLVALLFLVTIIPLYESQLISFQNYIPVKGIRMFYSDSLTHTATTIRQRRFFIAFLFGTTCWVFNLLAVYAFLNLTASKPISSENILVFFIVTTLSYLIPILPGGMGAYEAGAIFVLSRNNLTIEESLVLGITLHVVSITTCLTLGSFIMIRGKIGIISFARKLIRGELLGTSTNETHATALNKSSKHL